MRLDHADPEEIYRLQSNTIKHIYQGGRMRAEFLGEENPVDDFRSEEWIFSTNRAITPGMENPESKGISKIIHCGKEVLLTDLITDNVSLVGTRHYEKYKNDIGILLKIFNVAEGEYLPIHWHPDNRFAREYLNSAKGKTEAWYVLDASEDAKAWLGWNQDISIEEIEISMERQDTEEILGRMNQISLHPGMMIPVSAGMIHSIRGEVCILEIQQPTDFSFLINYEMFGCNREDALLNLKRQIAIESLDRRRVAFLGYNNFRKVMHEGSGRIELLSRSMKRFFNAYLFSLSGYKTRAIIQANSFYCLTVTKGEGILSAKKEIIPIKKGESYFIPDTMKNSVMLDAGATVHDQQEEFNVILSKSSSDKFVG